MKEWTLDNGNESYDVEEKRNAKEKLKNKYKKFFFSSQKTKLILRGSADTHQPKTIC